VFHPVGAVEPPPPREVLLEPNVVVLTPTFVLLLRPRIGRRPYHPSQVTVEALPLLTAPAEPPPP
jgi:hypothetical protein